MADTGPPGVVTVRSISGACMIPDPMCDLLVHGRQASERYVNGHLRRQYSSYSTASERTTQVRASAGTRSNRPIDMLRRCPPGALSVETLNWSACPRQPPAQPVAA